MQETVNNFWRNVKKYTDIWFFFIFLITFPLSIRKVVFFFPLGGAFNEYTGIYLYSSDLLFILTFLFFLFSILYNDSISLSRYKLWINRFFHNLYLFIPAILVFLSFASMLWSQNQTVAYYRSLKLFEGYLIYLYVALRFIPIALFHACPVGAKRLYGVEQCKYTNQDIRIVPRGTIEELSETANTFSNSPNRQKASFSDIVKKTLNKATKYISTTFQSKSSEKTRLESRQTVPRKNCSTLAQSTKIVPRGTITTIRWSTGWNNFLKLIVFLGLIESLIGIIQFIIQHSIGLTLLKESVISPSIPGVAKLILGGQKYIRAYGLFPHPNILGGFLLFSIIITLLYKKQLFHACPVHSNCSTWNNWSAFGVEQSAKQTPDINNVPRGTIAKPENISSNHQFYQKLPLALWAKNTLYKSQNLTETTFQSKSGTKKSLLSSHWIVPRFLRISRLFRNCSTWNNWSVYKIEKSENLQNRAIVQITAFSNLIKQKIKIFFNQIEIRSLYVCPEFPNCSTWNNWKTEKTKRFPNNNPRDFIVLTSSRTLRLFHVEQFSNKETRNTLFSRGTTWLIKSLKNIYFSFKKLRIKKLWLIQVALLIQILALFLSFSKSAILGLLIALGYIKLFHNVPRGTLTKNKHNHSAILRLKQIILSKLFHVEQLKKIILLGLILLLLAFLVKPNLNALFFQSLEERMFYVNASPVVASMRDLMNVPLLSHDSKLFHVEQFNKLNSTDLSEQNIPRGTITDLSTLAFGIGAGQFVLSLPEYSQKPIEIWQFQPVHNIYLEMWSELGLLGLGLFLWLIWKLFHVEQFEKQTKTKNCSTWNNQCNKEINQNVPRGTFETCRAEQLKNEQETATQNSELKESILCNDYCLLSIHITLRYFQGILLGLLFIGLFDHYLWDIWPGQLLLWLIIGMITGIKSSVDKTCD